MPFLNKFGECAKTGQKQKIAQTIMYKQFLEATIPQKDTGNIQDFAKATIIFKRHIRVPELAIVISYP